ncbi:hypothetical protein [Pseudomonas indica]|uniref:hypothetical protein n=1 Tax=Pseudomonas indica TaxID=137658 RepID=UPI003FD23922
MDNSVCTAAERLAQSRDVKFISANWKVFIDLRLDISEVTRIYGGVMGNLNSCFCEVE